MQHLSVFAEARFRYGCYYNYKQRVVYKCFRTLAADQGIVLAAGWWGKFKTTFQMIMIIVLILDIPLKAFDIIGWILIWISLALTIISMIEYVSKNFNVLKN